MKALVVFKFDNKIKLLLEDGNIIKSNDADNLHPALKQWDVGELYDCPIKRKMRFRHHAVEVIDIVIPYQSKALTIYQGPDNIIPPKRKRGRPKKNVG